MHEMELNIDVPSAHMNEVWRTVRTHSAKDNAVCMFETNKPTEARTYPQEP